MVKIVVDTPTKEGLGFKDYADALVSIIVDSDTPFTIGILGEWGVGKTSLMKTMCGKLKYEHGKKVIPVWFNAWRCERERNLAIIPLLEALMGEITDENLKEKIKDFLKSLRLTFDLGPVKLTARDESQKQIENELYYDKLKAVEKTLENTNRKIVVFIDDLDRCAPDKILEVLESTKVFLDIKGFVYVLGLNYDVVVKAIDQKYEALGVNGGDYLEKILQIPFRIPDWDASERGKCIDDLIKNDKIAPAYKGTFEKNKDIIKEVIERTPRQVKQFINTYICEQEVFKDKNLDQTTHLILTILKFKWYDFYQKLFDEGDRKNLKELLRDKNKLREELKDKESLVDFIEKVGDKIDKIIEMSDTQLSEYRRAGMIISQKNIDPVIINTLKLKDENPDVRWSAVAALEKIGGTKAAEALTTALGDEYEPVRFKALEALVKIGAEAVEPLIKGLLNDMRITARYNSAAALRRIGSPKAKDALTEVSNNDRSTSVRSIAKDALDALKEIEAKQKSK